MWFLDSGREMIRGNDPDLENKSELCRYGMGKVMRRVENTLHGVILGLISSTADTVRLGVTNKDLSLHEWNC